MRRSPVDQFPDLDCFVSRARDLRYILFSGRAPRNCNHIDLYNRAYVYWFEFWQTVLKKNGSVHTVAPYDFMRADRVGIVTIEQKKIAAVYLHNLLNFRQINISAHPYLRDPDSRLFVEYAQANNVQVAMTVEHISVDPEWRKSKLGKSLNLAMLDVAAKLRGHLDADAIFIKAREDVKVSNAFSELGGLTLKSGIEMHNTPVSFMVLPPEKLRALRDQELQNLANRLWNLRLDLTESVQEGARAA